VNWIYIALAVIGVGAILGYLFGVFTVGGNTQSSDVATDLEGRATEIAVDMVDGHDELQRINAARRIANQYGIAGSSARVRQIADDLNAAAGPPPPAPGNPSNPN
jgi:hypothetical protein